MTFEELDGRSRATIARGRPHCLRFYEEFLSHLVGRIGRRAQAVHAAARLAVAAEYQYISFSEHVDVAVDRNEVDMFTALTLELSRTEYRFARIFLSTYPRLGHPLGGIAGSLRDLAKALAPLGKDGEMPFRLAIGIVHHEDPSLTGRVFHLATLHCPGIVAEAAQLVDREARVQRSEVHRRWLTQVAELFEEGRIEAARSTLLLTSPESRSLLGLRYVVLSDLRRMLSIYCTSVAEKQLSVADTAGSTFRVGRPYTDGSRIFLPGKIDYFSDTEANRSAYVSLAALQAALFSRGSFSFRWDELPWINELRDRYGPLIPDIMDSVRRAYRGRARLVRDRPTGEIEAVFDKERVVRLLETPHEQFFHLFPTPSFVRELFILIERTRMKRALAARYPGLRDDIAAIDATLGRRVAPVDGPTQMQNEFHRAVAALVAVALQPPTGSQAPATGSVGRFLARMLDRRIAAGSTVADSARLTFDIYNTFFDSFPLVAYAMNEDTRELFEPYLEFAYLPEVVRDVEPGLFAQTASPFPRAAPEARDETTIDLSSLSRRDKGSRAVREALLSGDLAVFRYPEYDVARTGYRQAHTTLFESSALPGNAESLRGGLAAHAALAARIRKRFSAMVPEEVEVSRKWLDGEEIDLSDATDYAIDLLRGAAADEKVYRRKAVSRRDIATYVLIDASSSTEELVAGERIIDIEKASVALLAQALQSTGDAFAVAAFFSMNRNNVFFQVAKPFHGPWNAEAQGRLAGIGANAGNRDGCALRHATRRLCEVPHRTRLLLFLSDGIPADAGYGGDEAGRTSRYAIEDTRRALLEARRSGITPFCITVDAAGHSYLPYLYGRRHYRVIKDVEMLPEALSRLYERITA